MSSPSPVSAHRPFDPARLRQEIAAIVSRSATVEAALESVLEEIAKTVGFTVGQAWMPVAGSSALEWRAAWRATAALKEFVEASRAIVFSRDEGLLGKAWSTREPLFIRDLTADAWFYRAGSAQTAGLETALVLPLVNDGQVVVVLEFLSAERRELDDAALLALRDTLVPLRDVFTRERERALLVSQGMSRRLFESPMIGIVFWDRQGRILDANDAFLEMIGYTREELDAGLVSWRHLSADNENTMDGWVFQELEANAVCPPFEKECVRKDGRRLTVLMGGSLAPESGTATSYVLDVSERRRVLDALRESEERFRAFMDNSPAVAFMKDSDGTHLYHNALWTKLFEVQNAIGLREADIFPPEVAQALREHDLEVLASGRPVGFWEQVPTADGVMRDWLTFKFPFEPSPGRRLLGGVAVDMTDRKHAEAALHASEERYRNLVEYSPDCIFLHNAGVITFINQAGARLLGAAEPDQIVGKTVFDFVHSDHHHLVRERIAELEGGHATPPVEQKWLRLNGTPLDVEVFATPSQDGKRGIQVVARDITERKQAEGERARLLQSEQAARAESEALSRRLVDAQENERRRIARELHDEVGQILTGLSLMLKSGPAAPGSWRDRCDEMQRVLHDLTRRVREMSLDLRPAMLDDLGLLAALLWLFQRYTAQTRIRVNFHHFGLDRRFPADLETAAYRIVQEALTNTARYARINEVDVHLRARPDVLWIRVTDRGAGFNAERMSTGQSMGLAGMRERVAAVGGRLRVDSAPREGTYLTAWLPLTDKPASEEP